MAGRPVSRRGGGHPEGAAAQRDGLLGDFHRLLRIVQRHEADADQARIGAEGGHGPVVRPGPGEQDLGVLAVAEVSDGRGGEDKLTGKAQFIQGAAALLRVEGAIGDPALGAVYQLFRRSPGGLRIGCAGPGGGHLGFDPLRRLSSFQMGQQRAVGMGDEPVSGLHHMAVGVVIDAPARIGSHGFLRLGTF